MDAYSQFYISNMISQAQAQRVSETSAPAPTPSVTEVPSAPAAVQDSTTLESGIFGDAPKADKVDSPTAFDQMTGLIQSATAPAQSLQPANKEQETQALKEILDQLSAILANARSVPNDHIFNVSFNPLPTLATPSFGIPYQGT